MSRPKKEFSHYHKPCPYDMVDVYRVLQLFDVTDPALQHAIKKLLVAGGRGAKNARKDVDEAIVALQRYQEMRDEEAEAARVGLVPECICEIDNFSCPKHGMKT